MGSVQPGVGFSPLTARRPAKDVCSPARRDGELRPMNFDLTDTNFLLKFLMFYPAFLFALTVHEVAHALTANWGGDLTATYQNRLTLNPVAHMDIFGTVLVPIILLLQPMFFIFGWARPVPVDEGSFRDKAWNVVVSLAGPFSNLLLAVFGALFFTLVLRLMAVVAEAEWWSLNQTFLYAYSDFVKGFVMLNFLLLIFNLIPVPPLDGSHVLFHFFIRGHAGRYGFWDFFQRFGFMLLFILIFFSPAGMALGIGMSVLSFITMRLTGFDASYDQAFSTVF